MNEFEKIKALLIAMYGKSEEDVKALISKKGQDGKTIDELKEDWQNELKTLDAEKSALLNQQIASAKTAKYDEGHNSGVLKKAKAVEAALKAQFGDIEGKTIEEKIAALKVTISNKKPEDFNAKESEEYKELLLSIEEKLNSQKTEYETKLEAERLLRQSLSNKVTLLPLLQQKFKKLNVVSSAATLPNQLSLALDVIRNKGVSFKDGIVYLKGEILVDEHAQPLKQDAYLDGIVTSYFPTKKQEEGDGAGGQDGGAGGGAGTFDFSGKDALKKYAEIINNPDIKKEDKLAAKVAYEKAKG